MKRFLVVLIAAIVLAGLAGGYAKRRNALYATAFQHVQQGQPSDDVQKQMGRPTAILSVVQDLWWGEQYVGPNDGRCVKEWRYTGLLSPGAWVIGFDRNDRPCLLC